MSEQPPKRFRSDFAFADVLVPVDAPAQGNLGVVDVKNRDTLEADRPVDQLERGRQSSFGLDVIPGSEKMRGIKARPHADALQRIQHLADFFQARPERAAHPRGVFDQNAQRSWRQVLGSLLNGFDGEPQGLIRFAFAASAGMHDHKIGPQRDPSNQLVMKGLYRSRAQHWLLRRQVDQIICVNDQRPQAKRFAARAKRSGIYFADAGRTTGPHARAGRENLQRVAAELVRGFERVEIAACNGRVDANPQSTVHPGRGAGFRLRFGAVFVFRIEFDDASEGLFRHSQ